MHGTFAERLVAGMLAAVLVSIMTGCAVESDIQTPEETLVIQNQVETDKESVQPRVRSDGRPFRIGVIDIDPYPYSGKMVYALIEALQQAGWINPLEIPFDRENTDVQEMIGYLARQDTGPYMEFVGDCNYYLAYDGEQAVKESLNRHIYELKDIDMLWALGTWPANVAREYTDAVPVVCYPLSAAKDSGVVQNHDFSGVKNLWAQTDPERYVRQMKVFHEVVGFSSIGVIYYNRGIAALGDYERSASQLGVELHSREIAPFSADPSEEDIATYYDAFHSSVKDLVKTNIDAFLLTTDMIKDEHELDVFLAELEGIPICVQSGDNFVEKGCLLTVDVYNAAELGYFVAEAIGLILNGQKPEELMQICVSTPYLVLNLDALKKLEIQASFELLMSSEKIYYSKAFGENVQ